MATTSKTYDVFISHAAGDVRLATELAEACRRAGLEAVTYAEILPTDALTGEAIRDALAESRALMAVLSPAGPTPTMAIEIGAARAWNKPIFAIVTDPSSTSIPAALSGVRTYPVGRIDEVIETIRRSAGQVSDDEKSLLAALYADMGTGVDELALDPFLLEELVQRFNSRTNKALSGERLLSELLRMRKQGKLRRHRSSGRTKPASGTA